MSRSIFERALSGLATSVVLMTIAVLTGCAHGAVSAPLSPNYERTHDALLVLIPGRGDDPSAFERAGFVAELTEANTDHVIVEAPRHLRQPERFTRMLHERVVSPARAAGYERVVLAGVSQGGFRVLDYVREHGSSIDGAVVIAPFLGPNFYIDDIHRQGGLDTWSKTEQQGWWTTGFSKWSAAHHIDGLWQWVQDGGAADVDLHIAWGTSDMFAPAAELLADELPDSRRLAIEGGHEWLTWKRLWSEFLRRDPYGLMGSA